MTVETGKVKSVDIVFFKIIILNTFLELGKREGFCKVKCQTKAGI